MPNALVSDFQSHKNFYYQVQDDYNLRELSKCLKEENVKITLENIMFLKDEGDTPETSAFCSFWLGEKISLQKIRSFVRSRHPEYIVALYDYDKVDNKDVDIALADTTVKEKIAKNIHLKESKKLLLKKIITYGKKRNVNPNITGWKKLEDRYGYANIDKQKELFSDREFLVFVYKTDF